LLPTRLLVCAAISAALAWPTSAFGWTWPVQGPVLRPFLLGDDPYAAGQHRGIDIGSPSGASVLAPAAGVVSFTGTVPVGGRTVSIQTEDGYSVTVLHLGSVAVRRGASIA
jgi:murein DD-endopeptidase MepM/ murein hydrolase activator NlpD